MKTTSPDMTDEEKAAAQAEEDARRAELQALKDQAEKANLDRARAEGALEATRAAQATQAPAAPAQYTEEQWATLETQTGMSRQALQTSWAISEQAATQKLAPIQKELAEAKKKAEDAERRAADLEARGVTSATETTFYSKHPAFTNYKDKIDEFLSEFPEASRKDPAKLAGLLEKAKTYVKGLAGGAMRNEARSGSQNLGGRGDDILDDGADGGERLDYTGLHEVSERRTVEDLARSSRETMKDRPELSEALKKSMTSDGTTVRFDFEAQFKADDARRRKGRGA